MDSLDLLRRTVGEADTIIQGLDDDQLGMQTPCTDWTVRDLLNHITGGATMFALSAEHGSVPDDVVGRLMGGDNLGDDFKGAWKAASTMALTAFEQPGVMDKTVTLPFGDMPAGVALNIAVFDVATHVCDLATSLGTTVADGDLLESALAMGKQMIGPEMRQPGVFGPEQPCADDAPVVDRLLAFAGRSV
jgi:uncharacterized protein (TIGR03086 family)